ncbi:putative reverse transcriptase domain-containing protein [Tanacetum coccineum]
MRRIYYIYDLELGAVVFALKIWRHYLYGTKSVIYMDHESLQHIFSKKELNMRQRRWIELFSDYDCENSATSGKAICVEAQKEAVDEFAGLQKGLDEMIEQKSDGTLYYLDRIWVPLKGEVRTLIMDEAHKSKYYVHPGADKMYYDLRDRYWWSGIKKDIAEYVSKCLTFLKLSIKWASGFFSNLRSRMEWDGLDYTMDRLARLYLNEIVAKHGLPISIISDRDSRFTSRLWKTLLKAVRLDSEEVGKFHLPLVQFLYNNSYILMLRCAPFEAFYVEKCRSQLCGLTVSEGQLSRTEFVKSILEDIVDVGDYVLLKVSPWKGVVCFGKKGKLAPRFVGPFEIIVKVGPVAYRLDLSEELNGVHDTFHVSNLKKCLANPTLKVPLDEIRVDAKLNFVEEPMEILERGFKKLKRSRIAIIKGGDGFEFEWSPSSSIQALDFLVFNLDEWGFMDCQEVGSEDPVLAKRAGKSVGDVCISFGKTGVKFVELTGIAPHGV